MLLMLILKYMIRLVLHAISKISKCISMLYVELVLSSAVSKLDCHVIFFQRNGTITDFVSFYTLPSTIMHHPQHKLLKAAYSFYNVSTVTPWVDLMQDALIVARNVSVTPFVRSWSLI